MDTTNKTLFPPDDAPASNTRVDGQANVPQTVPSNIDQPPHENPVAASVPMNPPTTMPTTEPQPIAPPTQSQMPVPTQTVATPVDPGNLFQRNKKVMKVFFMVIVVACVVLGLVYLIFNVLNGRSEGAIGTKGKITWWGTELDESEVSPLIESFQSAHPGVTISYVKQSPQEYRERLTNSLAKGAGPDIFEYHNSWPPMFQNDLSVMPASIMTPDEFKGKYYAVISTDLTSSKGIVGMPLFYDAITLYVNEDIFSSALKNPPRTWNEVKTLADPINGLTQKDPNGRIIQSAIALGTTDNVQYWPEIIGLMMYQNNANFGDVTSTTAQDVASFYQYFNKSVTNWDSTLPSSVEAFAKQKTAMVIAPTRVSTDIIQAAPAMHFKTYPLPQLEKERPDQPNVAYATYWVEGVWEKSASKKEAWEFLQFLGSSESLKKINEARKNNKKQERAYAIASLNQQYINDPILGSIISLASSAKSWYLADRTNDGATGINTQLKKAYELMLQQDSKSAQSEITKILNQYSIVSPK